MNGARMVVFVLGLALILVGAWMLFVQANLSRWIPIGIAGAGLLVLIGLLVIGFSENASSDHEVIEHVDEHHRY
jgi:CHASE2 domain-containing sensor protein